MNKKESSLKQYISQLTDFYTTSAIKARGNAILRKNNVELLSYDDKSDLFEFSVLGNHRYTVYVRDLRSHNVKTSCTCPYSWGMCKHTVAALKYLAKQGESVFKPVIITPKVTSVSKPSVRSLRTENGYEILKWRVVTLDFIKQNCQNKTDYYYADYQYKNVEAEKVTYSKNRLTMVFNEQGQPFTITFVYKSDRVYISSGKGGTFPKLNGREVMALVFIAKSENPNLLDIIFTGKTQDAENRILEEYGLTNKKFNDYFETLFSLEGLFSRTRREYDGLLPVKELENDGFTELVHKINEDIAPTKFLEVKAKQKKRTLGFVLGVFEPYAQYYHEEFLPMQFKPVSAKLNKAGTEMINSFRFCSEPGDLEDFDIHLTKEQEELMGILWKLDEDDGELSLNEVFRLQKRAWELLFKERFVYRNILDENIIRKKDLVPLKISPEPLEAFFEVASDDTFVKLAPKIRAGGKEIRPDDLKKTGINSFFYLFENVLFVAGGYSMGIYLNTMRRETKMVKSHKSVFYEEVVKPLSKNMEVVFNTDIYDVETIDLDFDKKQVFLSEKAGFLVITPQVEYQNGIATPLYQTGDVLVKENGKILQYHRNFELEDDFAEFLSTLHSEFQTQKSEKVFYLTFEDFSKDFWFYRFFDTLRKNEVEIYGLKELKNFNYSPHRGKITTSVKSGIDWFEVNVELVFGDNSVTLKDIRNAVINKEKYIRLKDGSVGILPDEWFHKLEKYFRHGEVKDDKLEISRLKFSVIDELFENISDKEVLQEIEEKKQRLSQFREIGKTKIPKEIKADLRHYQKEGVNWLNFLNDMGWGGILADDMGLGKTLQVLTFLQQIVKKDKSPSLIVVPTTLLFNWEAEIKKFAPKLKAYYYYGTNRQKNTDKFKKYPLVFTTYGVMMRDIELLKGFQFNYVILDESQAVKNPASRRYKAVHLLKAKNRLALTGTPIENSTFDLYAQMSFVNPGFFGSISRFKTDFSNPVDKEGNEVVAAELQKTINPFILRRTKEMVAKELPSKTEDVIYCDMDKEQRKVYDAFRNEYRNKLLGKIEKEGVGKSKMMVLEALMRLRQICDSPLLLNKDEITVSDSVKIREIIRHITDKTAHHKILIFSQFVRMLHLIRSELDKLDIAYEYLDGKSSRKQRAESVRHFQEDPDLRVFLISLKAGGTGINLTAADYVYVVDPWWNPAVENQAIDRCYRIGQDKKVFAYRMICTDTVEEKILKLQQKKVKIATDIIQTDESIMKNLKTEDIETLFS